LAARWPGIWTVPGGRFERSLGPRLIEAASQKSLSHGLKAALKTLKAFGFCCGGPLLWCTAPGLFGVRLRPISTV
jgi:hypothetical protein